jgi:hypothetical protein
MRSLFSHCLFCCMQLCWWRVQLQELLRVRGGCVGVGDDGSCDDGGGGEDDDDGDVVEVCYCILKLTLLQGVRQISLPWQQEQQEQLSSSVMHYDCSH